MKLYYFNKLIIYYSFFSIIKNIFFKDSIYDICFIDMIFSDKEFIKLKKRDPAVFEKFYNCCKDKLYNYLAMKIYDNNQIFEIISDTFYSAYLSVHKLKRNENIINWLLLIASRRLNDFLRKKYRKEKYEISGEADNYGGSSHSDCLEEKIIEKEKLFLLKTALQNIKEEYSMVLELKYIQKKTQKEISAVVNKSISAVEGLLFKGRKALKKEIKKLSNNLSIGGP